MKTLNKTMNLKEKKILSFIMKAQISEKNCEYDNLIKILEKIQALDPDHLWAQTKLFVTFYELSKYEELIPLGKKLIKLDANINDIKYYYYLGEAFLKTNRLTDLESLLVSMRERFDVTRLSLLLESNLALAKGDGDNAVKVALKLVKFDPTWAGGFNNLGTALSDMSMFEPAAVAFDTALKLDPTNPDCAVNLAYVHAKLNRHAEATSLYEDLLKRSVTDAKIKTGAIKFFLSFEQFQQGNLTDAWRNYEAGFSPDVRLASRRNPPRQFKAPLWQGEPLEGRRLLVWREQGLGDELMFLAAMSDLLARESANIILECDNRLVSILQRSFPDVEVRPQYFDPLSMQSKEDYEFQVPLGTLVGLYRKDILDFSNARPYIVPLQKDVDEVGRYFKKSFSTKINVGICWRSGTLNLTRNKNYTNLSDWAELLSNPNVNIINLQYGDCESEIQAAEKALGIRIHRWPDLDLKNDFEGVFAVMKALDVIVTVGTAVSAMGPAVGTPTIRLSPPSWSCLGTDGWPWLPNVHQYWAEPDASVADLIPLALAKVNEFIAGKHSENAIITTTSAAGEV
jgi:tetratricopeptide (TPR) repeat protein